MPKNKKAQDQDQSDNQDSDDSQKQLQINTDNSPKIIPVAKLPDKLKYKKIVLNVSDTQYPIVTEIGQQLGWIIQDEQGAGDWDIWWTDRQIEPNTLYRINLHQKINHFPGIYVLARKNLLGLHLMAMQKKFPNDYNFFPQTWMLPMQFHQFRQYYQSVEQGKVRTYIVKPEALSQGRGIFLTRSIEDVLNGRKYVVQKYLKNPLLLDGLKFDLRIYVLLAGSQPLRLYIYEQGLARLATRPYQVPTAQNLSQNYIHLTNYSLNKTNPDYVFNKSDKDMDVGHKRSLKGVYQRLAKNGIDIQKLKTEIQECIVKTVISGLPSIRHQYKYCQPQEYEGFDVMILDDHSPIVIEVNHTPSFETATPLDYMIKKNLIKDTLKLMRINTKQKKTLFQKAKQLTKRVQTGKRDIFKGQQRQQQLDKVQQIRDQQEHLILESQQKRSGYKVIFPFKDQKKNKKYAKFYEGAEKVMKELKDMRKKIISQQNSSSTKKQSQPTKMNLKGKNSSTKQISLQRSLNKKVSIYSNSNSNSAEKQQKQSQRSSSRGNHSGENMSSSGNESCQNDKNKMGLDTILQNHDQHDQHINDIKSTLNTSDVIESDNKIACSSANGTKNNFHIRNNNYKKKNSFNLNANEKAQFSPPSAVEEVQYNFQSKNNKYQQLMSKFVKSKDLEDVQQNRISIEEGNILLDEKFNQGRKSKNSNRDQGSVKQMVPMNYYTDQKQKYSKKDIVISSIKGYKQKIITVTQQQNRGGINEKFQDSHISIYQNNKTSKGLRNYGYSGHSNLNFINELSSNPFPIEKLFPNSQYQKPQTYQQMVPNSKPKDPKNQKADLSKLGKFLKPKTYNLHQSKFPQQNKFIVRVDPINNSVANYKYETELNVNIQGQNGGILSFHQYNELCTNITSGVTAQIANHGYGGKAKMNINQRNVSSFVNTKPSTSHKIKSNSMICKTNAPIVIKDQPVLFKIIEKSKIKGYQ